MKKRLFPLLLALMLLLTLCTPFAQAEGRTLSITSASGRAGETVSVQVRLTGSVYSGRFELAYDAAELELLQWSGADGAMCVFNHEQPGLLLVTFVSTTARKTPAFARCNSAFLRRRRKLAAPSR